jgi:sulfite exporter TauE/SafE
MILYPLLRVYTRGALLHELGVPSLIPMFFLGFLGSGHCLGMCGPLVIALPGQFGHLRAHLLYHAGRLTMYTAIGAALGGLESGLGRVALMTQGTHLDWIVNLQWTMSGIAALFMLLFGLNRLGLVREAHWLSTAVPFRIPGWRFLFGSVTTRKNLIPVFLIGLMLGLLPCGLSYAVFARALASGGFPEGGLLVFSFGLGTVPGLLLLGTGAGQFFKRYREQSDIIAGLIMIGMAASLIVDLASAVLSS